MKTIRYSRWDGTQEEFSLSSEQVLDAMSELMMEGLSLAEALEWMRRSGFQLGGMSFRVMGTAELAAELRQLIEGLEGRYHLDRATDSIERRFDDVLERERRALEREFGDESMRMNDFLARRHGPERRLADRIDRFRDHEFEDPEAAEDFGELLGEVDRLRALEEFLAERADRFRGPEPADYPTAQDIRERVEAAERLLGELERGEVEGISPDELRDLLGEPGARSLILLQDLERSLERAGYLRDESRKQLSPRAIRRIGAHALADVYSQIKRGRPGEHEARSRGTAEPRPDESRPYTFGDSMDLDVSKSLLNSVRRRAREGRLGVPFELSTDDLEVRERDFGTQTTTVLLFDLSWSMSWEGRFPAAKRVALALDHLIRTKYPRDRFFVVGFSTRARELGVRQLPEATWDLGEPFTNLQAGLRIAQDLIGAHPSPAPQILVVTDGQPTAYYRGNELHAELPLGVGSVSPAAVAETMKEVHRVTRRGITINTFMLDDAPDLVGFVERMTEINRGRAFFTRPAELGSYLMMDFVSRRKRRR